MPAPELGLPPQLNAPDNPRGGGMDRRAFLRGTAGAGAAAAGFLDLRGAGARASEFRPNESEMVPLMRFAPEGEKQPVTPTEQTIRFLGSAAQLYIHISPDNGYRIVGKLASRDTKKPPTFIDLGDAGPSSQQQVSEVMGGNPNYWQWKDFLDQNQRPTGKGLWQYRAPEGELAFLHTQYGVATVDKVYRPGSTLYTDWANWEVRPPRDGEGVVYTDPNYRP